MNAECKHHTAGIRDCDRTFGKDHRGKDKAGQLRISQLYGAVVELGARNTARFLRDVFRISFFPLGVPLYRTNLKYPLHIS